MYWFTNAFEFQLLAIELLFCWRAPRRSFFWPRVIASAAAYLALPHIIPNYYFNEYITYGWFTAGFLLTLLLSAGVLIISFRLTLKQLVFYTCLSHTLQHIVHCLGRVTMMAFRLSLSEGQPVEFAYFILIVGTAYFVLRDYVTSAETVGLKRTHVVIFAGISMLTIYLLSLWTTQVETETIGLQLFDSIGCVMLIIIMLDMFRFRRAERNEMIMLRLLRQEQEQHKMSKATVDVINRKCHDLKHQISALRRMTGDEQERSIEELEKAVLIYDTFAKTGNDDLDIIIAEKSILAESEGIAIRCIADGAKLGFMRTEDIYALMGNALDNAIEATEKVSGAERIITLRIAARGELVCIHVENPTAEDMRIVDGLPVTTKSDTDYHGFGTMSMRYIAEQYGGVLTTGVDDGIFSLDILIPAK